MVPLTPYIHINKRGNGQYQMDTNLDWIFDDEVTPSEIKSILGSFLSSIEDIFGEKMVTEAVLHYAEERGHLVKTPQGAALHLKSKGLSFKNWKK
jgi:hypothetical protein